MTTTNTVSRYVPKTPNRRFEKVDPRDIYDMSTYDRNEYLIEQLRLRVEVCDPKLVECVPRLIEFDLPHLVAALNDDTYILHLITNYMNN